MVTFATDITTLVFGRGAFQAEAIASTSLGMQGIGIGLWATTLGWILVRMLNAQRRNGTAATVLVCAYTANMAVNAVTFRWLGPFGIGLGEAARGLVLLIGTAQALGCAGLLMRMVARVVPVTLALGGAGLLLRLRIGTPPGRFLAGALLYGAVLVPWLLLSEPAIATWIRKRLARPARDSAAITASFRRRFPAWRSLKVEAVIEVGASRQNPLASLVLPCGMTPATGAEAEGAGTKASSSAPADCDRPRRLRPG